MARYLGVVARIEGFITIVVTGWPTQAVAPPQTWAAA
jgi:hypothetical protein